MGKNEHPDLKNPPPGVFFYFSPAGEGELCKIKTRLFPVVRYGSVVGQPRTVVVSFAVMGDFTPAR